jgi:hypothetical protein
MKDKKAFALVLAVLILLVGIGSVRAVSTVSTTTTLYFNIASVVGMTNTLPGVGGVTATAAGAATANVEFNSSTGNNNCVNAQVTGGTVQGSGTPIMTLDNTGTVNLNLSMKFFSAPITCIKTSWKTTWDATCAASALLNDTNSTIASDYTPAAAAQALYLWANFTACGAADTATRVLNVTGTNSA